MSILKTEIGTAIPNFLDSEVGLVTKTAQIPQSMGQTDGDRKTVFAGTVFLPPQKTLTLNKEDSIHVYSEN